MRDNPRFREMPKAWKSSLSLASRSHTVVLCLALSAVLEIFISLEISSPERIVSIFLTFYKGNNSIINFRLGENILSIDIMSSLTHMGDIPSRLYL